ncbi:MAG: hypothetical protein KDA84_27655, partial [Planctomycetaceae bacterium]|nr:hypothetical protein [Planctomycetaceae bacterium]
TTHPPNMLPTFRHAGTYQPIYLQLYLRELSRWGFPIPEDSRPAEYHRYLGDFLEFGKGEILIRTAA